MTEKPILFSAPMVRAILEGRKTQTRRVIKPQPEKDLDPMTVIAAWDAGFIDVKCPYGKTGDRLWVRERFIVTGFSEGWEEVKESGFEFESASCQVKYIANECFRDIEELTVGGCANEIEQARRAYLSGRGPSIHMPRWASRITLEITDIRVERLQDITQADACAEGVLLKSLEACDSFNTTPERQFCKLWKDINGPESWDKNPFVWVIEFKKI